MHSSIEEGSLVNFSARKAACAALLLLAPLFASAATTANAPVVNSVTVDYSSNTMTVNGSGFLPATTAPTVLFNTTKLVLASDTNTQIVATLPVFGLMDIYQALNGAAQSLYWLGHTGVLDWYRFRGQGAFWIWRE